MSLSSLSPSRKVREGLTDVNSMHEMLTNQTLLFIFETVATPWLQYVRLILVQVQYWCGFNTGVGSILVWVQYWCGFNTGAGSILVRVQYWCGFNTGAGSILVRVQYWCGFNTGAGSIQTNCEV